MRIPKIVLWIGIAAFVIGGLVQLKYHAGPNVFSIGKLEIARTEKQANRVLESWSRKPFNEGAGLGADYLFAFGYGLTFAAIASRWSHSTKKNTRKLAKVAIGAASLAIFTDCVENFFMGRMLAGSVTSSSATLTTLAATIKFLCIFVAIGFILWKYATERQNPSLR